MKRRKSIVILFLMMIMLVSCASINQNNKLTATGIYFDTVIQIDIWDADETVLDECLKLCEAYEQKFSNTIENSEISQINNSNGEPVVVSDETIEVLQKGIEYGKITNGIFDITISSVSSLWDFTDNDEGIIPDESIVSEALKHVDYRNIVINGNSVMLSDPQTKIDLGGIAKGYIADKIKEYLLSEGVEHALINLGGNSLSVGEKPDGSPFLIGIQKPFDTRGTTLEVLEICDQSVVTSGIYERYFESEGIIYHHILDTKTGYPVQNNLLQVTIISDVSADGDALSTACYALGLEEGSKLIKQLDGIKAIFITDDFELHYIE